LGPQSTLGFRGGGSKHLNFQYTLLVSKKSGHPDIGCFGNREGTPQIIESKISYYDENTDLH